MPAQRTFSTRLSILLVLAIVTGAAALGQKTTRQGGSAAAGQQGVDEIPKIRFEKYVLPNGLQVILHVDRKLPVVNVNQWYHVGSKDERSGRTGFAHLFEHMMFQGSKNAVGEYFSYVEKAGGSIANGGVNGTTSFDRTNYFATVPSGNLEYLLWLESDRLATLADAITKEKLDNQRDVVKNERRQSYENQPYGRAYSLITKNVFPAGHPYSHDVIGSHEDLTAASVEDVASFFRTYYAPNNLTLTIAGDFDPPEVKRLVEKYFGSIPPGPALDRPSLWIPRMDGEKIVEVKDRVPQEATYMAWPAPQAFGEDEAALLFASTILTDGMSSRLQKALVYDKQLCTYVYAYHDSREIAGTFNIVTNVRPGTPLETVEQTITDEISRFAKSGPTAEELTRAKTKWEQGYISGLERIGGFGGKADMLNMYNTFLGDPGFFEKDVERYRSVTTEAVRSVVARWLDNRNRLLLRFRPETSGREVVAADLDRTAAPSLGTDRPFTIPEVQTAKLENGMEIFVVTRPELPKVSVNLGLKTGSVGDPAGKEGVAFLTAAFIDQGTTTRKATEISDRLGDLGTMIYGNAGREYSTESLDVLKRNLDPAMAIAADAIRNPTFPDAEIDRERKRHLDGLAQQENQPTSLAFRVSRMLAFGPEHPYGRPGTGTVASVEKITAADLRAFNKTYWKPGGSALVFVGDITLEEATALARKHFGSWSGGSAPVVQIPETHPAAPGKVYLIDKQDAAQTIVSQVLPMPGRGTDDYYSVQLADAVWGGGGFVNRLNMNLREDKGYSYGVFSFPVFHSKAGWWGAGGGVQTDKTKESLIEFASELKNLSGAKPITEKELRSAKEVKMRSYSQEFETLGQVAGKIIERWSEGLPISDLQREPMELERTGLEDVNKAAQKYAQPGRSFMVLVGDRSKIEAAVRDLNIGDVVLLDAQGHELPTTALRQPKEERPVPGH